MTQSTESKSNVVDLTSIVQVQAPSPNPDLMQAGKVIISVKTLVGIALGIVVTLFTGGWATAVQVSSKAENVARVEVAAVRTEMSALRIEQDAIRNNLQQVTQDTAATKADLKSDLRETKDEVKGLRADLRVLFPAIPRNTSPDGGQ